MFNQREPLRAEGNLTYLEFIAVVKKLWEDTHPDIPIYPTGGLQAAQYPAITYGIEIRRTQQTETKPRFRQQIEVNNSMIHIYGQRFINSVKFTVHDTNAKRADQIIEAFEDFMAEWTPVYKRLGASEFTYSRRLPDDETITTGEDVPRRSVAYSLVTEKNYVKEFDKINEIVIDLRIFLHLNSTFEEVEAATPITVNIIDLEQATPSD